MKLSQLRKAWDSEVEQWLSESLDLTPYQKEKLRDREIVRFSEFYFYKMPEKKKINPLWRLTIVFYLPYVLLLIIFNPFKWLLTGQWGYGQKFLDKFHSKWVRKIGL
jgi:hypothetical protein